MAQGEEESDIPRLIHEPSAGILYPPSDGQHLEAIRSPTRPFRGDQQWEIVRFPEPANELQPPPGDGRDGIVGPRPQEGALRYGGRPDQADVRDDAIGRSFKEQLGRVKVPAVGGAPKLEASASPFLIVLLHQAFGGLPPPRFLQDRLQVILTHTSEAHEDRGVPSVMVGDEEGLGIRLHPEVALVVTALDHKCRAVLPQPRQKLAPDSEAGGAIRQAFLNAGKGERQASYSR